MICSLIRWVVTRRMPADARPSQNVPAYATRHLKRCERCRAFVETWNDVSMALVHSRPVVDMPSALHGDTMRAVRLSGPLVPPRETVSLRWSLVAAAAALAITLFVVPWGAKQPSSADTQAALAQIGSVADTVRAIVSATTSMDGPMAQEWGHLKGDALRATQHLVACLD